MNKREIARSIIMTMVLAWSALLMPDRALAETRYVTTSTAACSALSPAPCYTSIQSAINASVTGDSIEIKPGTYSGSITMPSSLTADFSLTLSGSETATTIITGGGSGTLLTASNSSTLYTLAVTIRKLTFKSAAVGISASQNVNLTVTNSIFSSLTSSAINLSVTTSPNILHSVFYQNGTAISRTTTSMTGVNNIFFGNTAVASDRNSTGFRKNSYHNNLDTSVLREETAVIGDPLFVKPGSNDFHLKTGSPCIDTGEDVAGIDLVDSSAPDIGAYGSLNMDTVPFFVSNLRVTAYTATTITVEWDANECYQIDGYQVFYGQSSRSYGAPIDSADTIEEIAGLSSTAPAPTGKPDLYQPTYGNTFLNLLWDTSPVAGATWYEVRYDTVSGSATPITVISENLNDHQLINLTNGTRYYAVVVPYAEPTYYVAVKAYYGSPAAYLSEYSNEASQVIGNKTYGTPSNEVDEYPDLIEPYPGLPNEGCFIATATYGYYSAPQVQVLRDFRDRYLLTNAPGRYFVNWYYTAGPVGARFLNEHSWLKPAARVALLPAVGGAYFMTRTATTFQAASLMAFIFVGIWFFRRRMAKAYGKS
ncbi:MAG: hypothetical protein A2X56_11295 [Nitrospirae bacterium GWC2_57_13]|nr:MAG: hypothetical protein A2X56_11295 [Nitrospirae bacterium GWC2_57_13]